jgi:hypothetical protein
MALATWMRALGLAVLLAGCAGTQAPSTGRFRRVIVASKAPGAATIDKGVHVDEQGMPDLSRCREACEAVRRREERLHACESGRLASELSRDFRGEGVVICRLGP